MNNGVPVNCSNAIVAFFAPIICEISDLKVTDVSFFFYLFKSYRIFSIVYKNYITSCGNFNSDRPLNRNL